MISDLNQMDITLLIVCLSFLPNLSGFCCSPSSTASLEIGLDMHYAAG